MQIILNEKHNHNMAKTSPKRTSPENSNYYTQQDFCVLNDN